MEHLVGIVVTAIVAGVGAFFGAYLKKRAENLATHADFQKLLAEQKSTTEATKAIEAKISIDVWSHQQRWDVQKTALLESLKELATAEAFLFRLVHTFSETKTRQEGWEAQRKEANEKYADALINFWRTQLAIEIVCGREIGNQFQEIDNIFKRVVNRAKQGEFSDIWDTQNPELFCGKEKIGRHNS